MADERKALIVATDQYSDPKLTRLNAPAEDARALAEVLKDPDVGAYEVETVLNKTCQEVEIAIASFFQAGARGDTLLLHFSCHGVKDLSGELYFATTDTKLPLLRVTAVSSSMVKTAMEESRASLILCLVDCCYSGAFTKSTKAAATVDLTERLGGRGRAVITASTSLQLALDGKEEPSLFTHAVVEGLRSGEADRDLDGLVTLDEFYNYVHEQVTTKNPDQTPVKSFDVQGEVYVARRGGPISTPAPLPKELSDTLAVGEDWQRMGAVSRLTDLLNSGHPGRALAARLELERVRDNDDSLKVRRSAAAALETAGEAGPMPTIPTYTEEARPRTEPRPESEPRPDVEEMAGTRSVDTDAGVLETAEVTEPTHPVTPTSGSGAAEGLYGISGTVTDKPTDGGAHLPPLENDNGGNDGGRRGRGRGLVITAAITVAALVAGLATWAVVHYSGDADDNDGGADDIPTLAASELLVVVTNGADKGLFAVDWKSPDSPRPVQLLNTPGLPTLSHDRQRMSYLVEGPEDLWVPHEARVDGSKDNLLLSLDERDECPFSGRPSLSLDGGKVALVCRDESDTSMGLFVEEDGHLTHVVQDSSPAEGPTWTGDGNIIFVAFPYGPFEPSRLMEAPPVEGSTPTEIDIGLTDWWLSHPDWSDSGLLFLRSETERKRGDVCVFDGEGVTRLTTNVDAGSPTWSPDGKHFAYLANDLEGDGELSLWVQEAKQGAVPIKIPLPGIPGPPAWGAR